MDAAWADDPIPGTRGPVAFEPAAPPAAPRAAGAAAPAGDADDGAEAAEEAEADDEDDAGPEREVTVGVDVASAYYDRGFLIEAQAFVVQPWVAVDVPLLVCTGLIDDLRFVADGWASLHDGESGLDGAPHAPKAFYEGDVWFGLAAHVRERLDLRVDYQLSWSPNGSFERFEELAFQATYDDGEIFAARGGRFRGFAPRAILAFETRGQNDEGRHLGRYLELGVEPRWSFCGEDEPALELSLPARVGLSVGDYYEDDAGDDETYGYVEAGVRLSVGLGRLSCRLDDVTVIGTVGGIWLGDHAAAKGDGRRSRLLAVLGVEWEL
ncbi:MAG: hypothetical protein U1E39_08285 [Planctomycetota bacterium]